MYCFNYVIKQGDTLYKISRHFQVGLDTIITANPLVNVYNLRVGEVICVPASMPHDNYTNYTTYLVEDQDTLGSVLDKHNMNLADLMEHNNVNEVFLKPGTTVNVPNREEENGMTQ